MRPTAPSDTLRLAQISDLNLASANGADGDLREVLDRLHGDGGVDGIVVTGDLVRRPSALAYRRLRRTLNGYPSPFHCLPGDHDDAVAMLDWLDGGNVDCPRLLVRGEWLLLFLDSCAPGTPGGELGEVELEFLDDTLSRHPAGHAMLFLHHPPRIGRPAWPRPPSGHAPSLLERIAVHDKVRGIAFGHGAAPIDRVHRGMRLLGTPPACPVYSGSWPPEALPGYRELLLHADGTLTTSVHYTRRPALRALA